MRFDVFGPTEKRFLSLMDELGGEYAKSTPSLALKWLLDRYYCQHRPETGDPRVEQVLSLWEEIVVPYTTYPVPVTSDTLKEDLGVCLGSIPTVGAWRDIFAKMVSLRGLCASGSFSLPRILAKREKGRLIFGIADGNYDTWVSPDHSGATLEQILDGRPPGDWLKCPKAENPITWKTLDQAAPRYCHLLCKSEPHTALWAIHQASDKMVRSMRGLLDPLIQHSDIEYWRTYGHRGPG